MCTPPRLGLSSVSLQLRFRHCPNDRLTHRLGRVPLCRIDRNGSRRRADLAPRRGPIVTLQSRGISLRGEVRMKRSESAKAVVDGAVRTRAGQNLRWSGSGRRGVRPGRTARPREALIAGQPRWASTGWVRRCRSRSCGPPAATPRSNSVGLVGAGESGVACSSPGVDRRGQSLLRGHGLPADPGPMRAPTRPRSCCAGWAMATSQRWVRSRMPCHRSRRPPRWSRVRTWTGRVVSYRWPAGGPPAELSGRPVTLSLGRTPSAPVTVSGATSG